MKSIFTGALIGDEYTLRDWGAIITNSDVIGMRSRTRFSWKYLAGAKGLICRKC